MQAFLWNTTEVNNYKQKFEVRNFIASFVNKIPVSQKQGAYSRVGIINVGDTVSFALRHLLKCLIMNVKKFRIFEVLNLNIIFGK